METVKRGRGRPKVHVDFYSALGYAGLGMTDEEICDAIKVSMSTWMRFLREGDHRERIQVARSNNIANTLARMMEEAMAGKTSAASYILARLEKRVR